MVCVLYPQALLATVAMRLRTRLFAAELLLRLVSNLEGEARHLDTSALVAMAEGGAAGVVAGAAAFSSEDILVNHLQVRPLTVVCWGAGWCGLEDYVAGQMELHSSCDCVAVFCWKPAA